MQSIRDGKPIIIEGLHLDPGLYLYEFGKYGVAHLLRNSSLSSGSDMPKLHQSDGNPQVDSHKALPSHRYSLSFTAGIVGLVSSVLVSALSGRNAGCESQTVASLGFLRLSWARDQEACTYDIWVGHRHSLHGFQTPAAACASQLHPEAISVYTGQWNLRVLHFEELQTCHCQVFREFNQARTGLDTWQQCFPPACVAWA